MGMLDVSGVRDQLVERFMENRRRMEVLCAPLAPEDYLLSVTKDTSPPKWHLAHTTWFLEHFLLEKFKLRYEPFGPDFSFLFNSYYKRLGSYLPKEKRSVLGRPTVEEIFRYRDSVTSAVVELFQTAAPHEFRAMEPILEIAINHEQQHQELLIMDIKRCFFENPLRPRYQNASYPAHTNDFPGSEWVEVTGDLVRVGVPKDSSSFSYDNEKDAHFVWIDSFELCSQLVTNDEYLAFIEEGGYHNPALWLSDGWDLKEREGWEHPLYWEKQGRDWWVMTLGGMIPLDLAAPVVHVSYYEAQAFAKWKGCRLPTEVEWEAAAKEEKQYGEFLDDGNLDPLPSSDQGDRFSQIHGAVWEWTQSAFLPYPRFNPFQHGLAEYNEKFMCNQFVLRGGSCVTPRDHYRVTYRNFYYPHMRWQYAGIRLAKDIQ